MRTRGGSTSCRGGVSSSTHVRGTSREDLVTTSFARIPHASRGRRRGRGGGIGRGRGDSRVDFASTSVSSVPLGLYDDVDDEDDLGIESSDGLHGSNATEHTSTHLFPSHREPIRVIGNQFCSGKPVRQITDNLKLMFGGPWISWKCIPPQARTRLWERFKLFFYWPSELEGKVYLAWTESMKKRMTDTLCKKRDKALKKARMAGLVVGDDLSVIIPFGPPWINHDHWVKMVEKWNTEEWKKISKVNKENKNSQVEGSVGKHTAGSASFLVTKLNMEKTLSRPVRYSEQYLNNHVTKRSKVAKNIGTGELEFVTPKSQRLLETYMKSMSDAYGDLESQPLGDVQIWEEVVGGTKKGRLEGCGGISDPSYLVTGEEGTSSHASSSFPTGVASSDEVQELKQQIREMQEREQKLLKEVEESRKREEESRKAMQDQFKELEKKLFSRLPPL